MLKNFHPPLDTSQYHFLDLHPPLANLEEEVLAGLSQSPKTISPKWFYDEKGSTFFNQITGCEEYYLTRTEISILQNNLEEILTMIGEDSTIIEYGCGDSEKIEILLTHLPLLQGYIPLDISKSHLLSLAKRISKKHPNLDVTAVCCDFTKALSLSFLNSYYSKKVAFFPGSSIGNFEPSEAQQLLKQMRQMVGKNGGLLIGADLIKDETILNAAYNDQQGWTKKFNLNLLHRIKRECGATFDLSKFQHHAYYNINHTRIEMHLISKIDQSVNLKGSKIHFKEGESIHTENSYKYDIPTFHKMALNSGWNPLKTWTDPKSLFSIHYLQAT